MQPLPYNAPANLALLDATWQQWKLAPDSVDATWRAFFEGFELAAGPAQRPGGASASADDLLRQSKVSSLMFAYRSIGHTQAHLDPLGPPPPPQPRLALAEFGLTDADLDREFSTVNYLGGEVQRLADVLETLRSTYCGVVGFEYIHIQDVEIRRWMQQQIEPWRAQPRLSREEQVRALRKIHEAEIFERFLHARYAGQKRFSLEGAETLIAVLDAVLEHGGRLGVKEIVMGMAHRGRLNVLANFVGKSCEFIFREFSENYVPDTVGGDGDVKYHLGYEAVRTTSEGHEVEVRLASNPSHLEAVDPVVEGKARARQRIRGDTERRLVLPLLVHGDAAFAGQGVVAETLNYSRLPGYCTGGTLHVVVNNQIGFTTSPSEARSSAYCTDIAKTIEAPIFHVNGDHPLHAIMAARLALEFRQKFQRDVVLDITCYRRHGHNETDEPMFTQPVLYQKIAHHPPVSRLLADGLVAAGTITEEESLRFQNEFTATLESALDRVRKAEENPGGTREKFSGSNAVFQPAFSFDPVDTRATPETIEHVAGVLGRVPDGFKVNPKIDRLLEGRRRAFLERTPVDWACAEALAFGCLLAEGTPVRLSGQDSERGTFSQRHCVLYDVETRSRYVPLQNIAPGQPHFCVYNSTLSEASVLGFDFGYSLDFPWMLCLWEAQFGDFANGAQVVVDQFIASSESKWQRMSSIVLLLPHGYEGQGPEHSSARLERFLQLCAEDNIQVANLTTPAQYFHLLRRQTKRAFRKPLVLMAPKSMLRHKAAVSPWSAFTGGRFEEILDDPAWASAAPAKGAPKKPARLVCCSGKVYYDLVDERARRGAADTAIVRIEQLYPLHLARLAEVFHRCKSAKKLVWCQEEPQNMGAWSFLQPHLEDLFGRRPLYAGREASASPAVGSLAQHKVELARLLDAAFTV
jgi:2-oxoglutarate dehydrogenase E1 component